MIRNISTLPNYCNGKLYKRWDSVISIFGDKAILASKTNKDGQITQLLISDNGKKRELYNQTSKIMDKVCEDGVSRTYTYERKGDTVLGRMFVLASDKAKTLITSASWINEGLLPKRVELNINPSHEKSNVQLTSRLGQVTKEMQVNLKKIVAEKFDDLYARNPNKLTLTLSDGSEVIESNSSLGNIFRSSNQDVPAENHPMDFVNVVV